MKQNQKTPARNVNNSCLLRQLMPIVLMLLLSVMSISAQAAVSEQADVDDVWESNLKGFYFAERKINEGHDFIDFTVPKRAENGAMVPIRITASKPQTEKNYIKNLWLLIDKNPKPLAGKFSFTPKSGKVDLSFRIRVDAYSMVRVIAETNEQKLYMASHFVKSSGGCSAPAMSDRASALSRLGKIRLNTPQQSELQEPVETRIAISHPNASGLQRDQVTTLYIPPHYISRVEVDFEGERVFGAETDISISENPDFRFYFLPKTPGEMKVTVTDTKNNVFTETHQFGTSQ